MNATINIASITMPAGEYFVGDPCYSVPDARWMEWLRAADYENEDTYLLAELDGMAVLGISTAYGDGEYPGSDGNSYPVDAGLIGVVPVELATEGSTGTQRVNFPKPFNCSYEDGVIRIGHITIDTDPDDDVDPWYS